MPQSTVGLNGFICLHTYLLSYTNACKYSIYMRMKVYVSTTESSCNIHRLTHIAQFSRAKKSFTHQPAMACGFCFANHRIKKLTNGWFLSTTIGTQIKLCSHSQILTCIWQLAAVHFLKLSHSPMLCILMFGLTV